MGRVFRREGQPQIAIWSVLQMPPQQVGKFDTMRGTIREAWLGPRRTEETGHGEQRTAEQD
jgi:hypothetical protein